MSAEGRNVSERKGDAPLLSIVLCTRNRAERLGAALGALTRIRTEHPFELLLVDNASTDDTQNVLHQFASEYAGSVTVLSCPTIGLGAARDYAWRYARGSVVSFTDDDCYVEPDYVDQLISAFAEDDRAGCVGGRVLLHNSDHARTSIQEDQERKITPPYSFVPTGKIHGANFAFRRNVLVAIGGIDPGLGAGSPFRSGEDIDAIAATSWAGYSVLYDPRPTVRHDHGRLPGELPAMRRNYDIGRGAYYAKYLIRPDSRTAYLKGWWGKRADTSRRDQYSAMVREAGSAARYMVRTHNYVSLAKTAPVVTVGMALITLKYIGRHAWATGRGILAHTHRAADGGRG